MKTTLQQKLEKLELFKIDNIYCLSIGKLIKSYVVVDLDKLECSLNYDDYRSIYRSFYKIKSREKAINLMLRIRKDLISCNSRNSCLALSTMQKLYKNYFERELSDYEINLNENLF